MSTNTTTLDNILTQYSHKQPKYFYVNSIIDARGIDYTKYVKIKFKDINENKLSSLYTLDGWYILYYLMSNGINGEYIMTNVNIIALELNMKTDKIINILIHLNKINIIKIKEDIKFDKNILLHIAIDYKHDEYKTNIGYRAIPIDYIKTLLPTMNSTEWGLLSVLLVNYNYYQPTQSINMSNGEPIYSYNENHYSFPTQIQMSQATGICDKTVRVHLSKLESNVYKVISVTKGKKYNVMVDNKSVSRQEVNKYYIPLLDRMDYIYQHIYSVKDSETDKRKNTLKLLNKDGFEKVSTSKDCINLISKDFIVAKWNTVMKEYEKIIKNKDIESYKGCVKYLTKY